MNRNQIITLIVGALLTFLASKLNIGVPTEDVQNGMVSLVILVYALLAKDANGASSILMQKTTITGIIGSIFWFITTVLKVNVGATAQQSIMGIILTLQGYYTLNHSSVVHELQGTVGTPSPTFAPKQ